MILMSLPFQAAESECRRVGPSQLCSLVLGSLRNAKWRIDECRSGCEARNCYGKCRELQGKKKSE